MSMTAGYDCLLGGPYSAATGQTNVKEKHALQLRTQHAANNDQFAAADPP